MAHAVSHNQKEKSVRFFWHCIRAAARIESVSDDAHSQSPAKNELALEPLPAVATEEWPKLVSKLMSQRIFPMVYEQLPIRSFAPDLQMQCRLMAAATMKSFHSKLEDFRLVHTILDEARVDYAPVKGLANALTIYKSRPVRYMADIDILVRCKDLAPAYEALYRIGFRPYSSPTRHRWHHHLITEEAWKRVPYIRNLNGRVMLAKDGTEVDIHFNPTYTKGQRPEELPEDCYWRGAVPEKSIGASAYLLAPEQQILLQTLHTLADNRPNLVHLVDLLLLQKHYGISIGNVMDSQQIRKDGAVDQVVKALEELSSPVQKDGHFAEALIQRYLDISETAQAPTPKPTGKEALTFHMQVLARLSPLNKLVYLAGFLCPAPEFYSEVSSSQAWCAFYGEYLTTISRLAKSISTGK